MNFEQIQPNNAPEKKISPIEIRDDIGLEVTKEEKSVLSEKVIEKAKKEKEGKKRIKIGNATFTSEEIESRKKLADKIKKIKGDTATKNPKKEYTIT